MVEEIWKSVVYDGVLYENYQVSNFGRVKSLNYRRTGKERVMTPVENKNGYFRVGLWKNGEYKKCLVHRLVAFAFLSNPDNLSEINHIDEDKTNNRVENLEWCDREYNNNYGTHNQRIAEKMTNGKLSKIVLQLTLTGELIREWPSTNECGRNGFHQGAVAACCRGERKTHKGFVWRYK